jgi:yecA family protein
MNEQYSDQNLAPTINFDDFCNLIAPLGAINSPSELHGLLCGKLSGGAELSEVRWLLDAVEFLDFSQAPDERVREALTALYYQTSQQLRDGFSLTLLLPDDDSNLSQRTAALGQWCYGFLTGFGSAGKAPRKLTEESEDGLRDLAAISQIAVEDGDESDEADYMEVTEYVRQLAASLFLECAAQISKASSDSIAIPASDQVH